MRAHKKIRALRAMAIASCIAGLALPAGAGAMPLGPSSSRAAAIENSQAHTGAADQTGARLDHRGLNATAQSTYVLPASFKS